MNVTRTKVAERIKAARSIAGYAERKAFCLKFGFPLPTMEAWERGINPLTKKGATRLIEALREEGIYCSEEWLREGKGISPRPLKELSENVDPQSSESLKVLSNNLTVAKEISTFITLNKDAVVTLVKDDAMLPFYKTGDYVGGVKFQGREIEKALNKKCIIELENGKTMVRQLSMAKEEESYILAAVNLNTTILPVTESIPEIISAAPVLWHRTFLHEERT